MLRRSTCSTQFEKNPTTENMYNKYCIRKINFVNIE